MSVAQSVGASTSSSLPTMGKAPVLLRWDVTKRCNLACLHCCAGGEGRGEPAAELSAQLKRGLKNAADAGVAWVHLLGGEPTVRRDFLEVVAFARGLGLEVSFNTNGIRQSPALLENVLNLDPISITVSVDGPDEESHDRIRGNGTFREAVGFVERLVQSRRRRGTRRPEIQLQSVLMAPWASRAGAIVELASRLGADSLVVNNLVAMGQAVQNWALLQVPPMEQFIATEEILHAMLRHPGLRVQRPARLLVMQYFRELTGDESIPLYPRTCSAIDQMCEISAEGTLVPCQVAHAQDMGGGLSAPSILDQDLHRAWNSAYFQRFAALMKADPALLYSERVPCNRCVFLGRGCLPCPIPAPPGQLAVNHLCWIAESLLQWGRKAGGLQNTSRKARIQAMREIVRRAPTALGQ
ncbi:MAG: radical SAM protein [Anaerolineae bacterium]